MRDKVTLQSALVSVYYKEGLIDLCRKLHSRGVRLYATQGTCAFLQKEGLPATPVESLTQFPEMMEGRVKTLHPRIFGGILARREVPKDLEEAKQFEVPLFDLVVANLYPFAEHLNEADDAQSSFIDIGGPSLLRAASKNFRAVTVVSDPTDYAELITELDANDGATRRDFRKAMATRTFSRTSQYDAMIAAEWAEAGTFPNSLPLSPQKALRYGENPHQKAAFVGRPAWEVLQGKELSYNNLLDAEAAVALSNEFATPAVAIIKHNNPCGAATGRKSAADLFSAALAADEKSAFGGIVAFNIPVDGACAERVSPIFLEVVIAPDFDAAALEIFSKKKNLRLIRWAKPTAGKFEVRRAMGGWLVQDYDAGKIVETPKTVTKSAVPNAQWDDLKFAWSVCKHVRSNAIVIAKDGITLSVGAGQMSRVDAVDIALQKAAEKDRNGAVLASDAFFPFRDNIDKLKGSGIVAVIQPGGSQRDAEVIEACDAAGIAMAFTGMRHFRH